MGVYEDTQEAGMSLQGCIDEMFRQENNLLAEKNRNLKPEAVEHGHWVEERTEDGWKNYFENNGVQCGLYREVNETSKVATWGEVGGKMWKADGKTLMVGEVDSEGRWDGEGVIYLYPGLTLAVIGRYEAGKLVVGREGVLIGLQMDRSGLIMPSIELVTGRTIVYERPGAHHIADNIHMRELVESINVYVNISGIGNAGEGLFAKTELKGGSLVSIFNGVRQRTHIRLLNTLESWSDYRVFLDSSVNIDIPDCYIPCRKYSSTLGHKACHSFSPNCRFHQVYHPRWGKVVCLVAYRDIARHEEITVCYGYKMSFAPKWYSDLWLRHLRTEYGWSREDAVQYGLVTANCQNYFGNRN